LPKKMRHLNLEPIRAEYEEYPQKEPPFVF